MKYTKIDAMNFEKKNRRQCKVCFRQLTRKDIKAHRRVHEDCTIKAEAQKWI